MPSEGHGASGLSFQKNPWINDRSIGSQRAVVDLAEKTGLLQQVLLEFCYQGSTT